MMPASISIKEWDNNHTQPRPNPYRWVAADQRTDGPGLVHENADYHSPQPRPVLIVIDGFADTGKNGCHIASRVTCAFSGARLDEEAWRGAQ